MDPGMFEVALADVVTAAGTLGVTATIGVAVTLAFVFYIFRKVVRR